MPAPTLPDHVHDNIAAIDRLREQVESEISPHQKILERIADGLGKPYTMYMLLAAAAAWIALNGYFGHDAIDAPPFFWLQGAIALYAATVSTLVLIAQTRQSRESTHRSRLEFHVNLLAEQKTTKLIALMEELRRDMPNVRDRTDAVADEMQNEVDPHLVHSAVK